MRKIWQNIGRISLCFSGFTLMYVEGQHNPQPGIWFAVGAAAVVLATLPWRSQ